MSKTIFSVMVSNGLGGTKVETRKSDHTYVACVIRTLGAAYVELSADRRAGYEADLVAARALLAARTAALGGMTVEVAEKTYRAANDAFWALSDADRVAARAVDEDAASGLSVNGPFGLYQAHHEVRRLERLLDYHLPVVGEQVAVSWHSTRVLASKARDALLTRERDYQVKLALVGRESEYRDDSYEVRTDIESTAGKTREKSK